MSILRVILLLFRALLRDCSRLALENLALRQQLAILRHKAPRPTGRAGDRQPMAPPGIPVLLEVEVEGLAVRQS